MRTTDQDKGVIRPRRKTAMVGLVWKGEHGEREEVGERKRKISDENSGS